MQVTYETECVTPCDVTLEKENGYLIRFSKPGRKPNPLEADLAWGDGKRPAGIMIARRGRI